jgi:ribose transport system ATP-binding protein
MATTTSALRMRDVSKLFPGQLALDSVSLELQAGEIHALVGQNGSGKSTLIKILAGYHQPEAGAQAWLGDREFELGSAVEADRLGMRFIHQDLGIVRALDTVDNLALGRGYRSRWWVSVRREAAEARRLLAGLGMHFDVRTPLANLSPAERSMVAIARALQSNGEEDRPRVLVLDEPTESLSGPDIERLFGAVRAAAAQGTAVLYISHRLNEVLSLADRVTVLRDGRIVATQPRADLDYDELVRLIVGRALDGLEGVASEASGAVAMRVHGLRGGTVEDLSMVVRKGEVVGIAGIVGSGRETLAALLGGARRWDAGRIELGEHSYERFDPRRARERGLVFVAADRQRESAIPEHTARENLTLPRLDARGPFRWLSYGRERREAYAWMQRIQVVPCEPDRILAKFSGGNQQKVVLAQALRCEPQVLVLDEPVQGVDVGAKSAILQLLLNAAANGLATVIASSDPEDLASICDRVLVFRDGRVATELSGAGLSADRIFHATIAPGAEKE